MVACGHASAVVGGRSWQLMVRTLVFVGFVGLQPVALLSAQELAWTCPESATSAVFCNTGRYVRRCGGSLSCLSAGGGDLTVFAAASLTDAFAAIERELEAAIPALSITYNFGGFQALVTQLEEGAEADVFASANVTRWTRPSRPGSSLANRYRLLTTAWRSSRLATTPLIKSAADR